MNCTDCNPQIIQVPGICDFIINAGTTDSVADNANGEETVGCGDVIHFYSSDASIGIAVQPGSAKIDLTYTPSAPPTVISCNTFASNPDPNTAGTTFYTDPDDPSGSVIAGADTSCLYIGTDGSAWIYDGTDYVTYTAPDSTEWYFAGTSVDAGSNKTGSISRPGTVNTGLNYSNPSVQLSSYNVYAGANNYAGLFLSRPAAGSGTAYGSYAQYYSPSNRSSAFGMRGDVWVRPGGSVTTTYGSYSRVYLQAGTTGANVYGATVSTQIDGNITGSNVGLYGRVTGTGNATGGVRGYDIGVTTSGNTGIVYGGLTRANPTSGNITTMYGHYIQMVPGAGVVSASPRYGLFLTGANLRTTSNSRFGIYEAMVGANKNYLRNPLGLNTANPSQQLSVVGTAGKTGGGAWAVFSDERIKKNVKDYPTGALDKLKDIRVVNYNYNEKYLKFLTKEAPNSYVDGEGNEVEIPETETTEGIENQKRIKENDELRQVYTGIIAQEIQKVLPNTVKTRDTGFLSDQLEFDPNELTYLLIKAVQELSAKVDELEGNK